MIEIVRDLKRLQEIGDAWQALSACNPTPMLSHEWSVAAAQAFGRKADIMIFALWDGSRLRAIAPLGLFRNGLSHHLRYLSHEICEPESLLFEDRAALEELLSAVTRQRSALLLSLIPFGGDEDAVLRQLRPGSFTYFGRIYHGHAAVLPPTVTQLDGALSKSARTMLRRKMKQAEKLGDVTFAMDVLDANNQAEFIADLVRVESSGWKRENGTSLSDLHDQRHFYEHYARIKAPTGKLRGYRMLIDGRTVAIRLGEVSGRKLHELKIGFDQSLHHCSPGIVLTQETLKAAIEEKLTYHEFLGSAEDWQKHWDVVVHSKVTVRRYPLAVNGALNLGKYAFDRIGAMARAS